MFSRRQRQANLSRRAFRKQLFLESLEDRRVLASFVDAIDDAGRTSEDTPTTINVLGNDVSSNGFPLTVTTVGQPLHGTTSLNSDGTVTYTPAPDFFGIDSFPYSISDGSVELVTAKEGASSLNLYAKANSGTGSSTLKSSSSEEWQSAGNYELDGSVMAKTDDGTVEMSGFGEAVWASPSQGQVTFLNVVWNRNQSWQGSASLAEGSGWTYQFTPHQTGTFVLDYHIEVTNTFGAQDLGEFRFAWSGGGGSSWELINADNRPKAIGKTSFRVQAGQTYTVSIMNNFAIAWGGQFAVTDREAMNAGFNFRILSDVATDSAMVTVTVDPVNDAPVANNDSATTEENTPVNIFVLANDTDVDGDGNWTVTIASDPENGTLETMGNGSYVYTPNQGFSGTDSFHYFLSDQQGGGDFGMVTVTVTDVNSPPVADDLQFSTDEDLAVSGQVSATDDGSVVTFTRSAGPYNGQIEFNNDGTFTYTPNKDFNGTDSFTYIANDGLNHSEPATVSLTIAPVNDAPVAHLWQLGTPEDTPLNSFLRASDVEGDPLTYTLLSAPAAGFVHLIDAKAGTFRYTPPLNYNGTVSFEFQVNDGKLDSQPATVFVTVHPVNDPPVTQPITLATDEDTPVIGTFLGSDVESTFLVYSFVTQPQHGTVQFSATTGTRFIYTPNPNYYGPDSFTYKANDRTADSNVSTVSITVRPVNDAPVATGHTATTDEDQPTSGNLIATDAEGAALTYAIVSGPSHGALVLNSETGAYTYMPTADYNGPDSFSFTASDGQLTSNTATVSITVVSVNDLPTATDAVFTLSEDGQWRDLPVLIEASDVEDGGDLHFSLRGADSAAFAIDAQTGQLSVRDAALLDFDAKSILQFHVDVRDSDNGVSSANITVHLTDVVELAMDILPSDPNNRINLGSATIEVAILALPGFNHWQSIDLASLRLKAPGSTTSSSVTTHPKHGIRFETRDVNGDGLLDLVLQFNTAETGLKVGDTSLQLSGRLLPSAGGEAFLLEQAVEAVASTKGRGKGGGGSGGGNGGGKK